MVLNISGRGVAVFAGRVYDMPLRDSRLTLSVRGSLPGDDCAGMATF